MERIEGILHVDGLGGGGGGQGGGTMHRTHRVRPGDTVLVHAAAGGVGLLLCQWARALGARVIGTVSSEAKAELARANGCEHPIVTRSYAFAEKTKQLTRRPRRRRDLRRPGPRCGGGEPGRSRPARPLGELRPRDRPPPPMNLTEKSGTFSQPVLFRYTEDLPAPDGRPRVRGAARRHPHPRRPPPLSPRRRGRRAPRPRGATHHRSARPARLISTICLGRLLGRAELVGPGRSPPRRRPGLGAAACRDTACASGARVSCTCCDTVIMNTTLRPAIRWPPCALGWGSSIGSQCKFPLDSPSFRAIVVNERRR